MKPIYRIGERISFIFRSKYSYDSQLIIGPWRHHVGYIKQVRRSLFGVKYVIIKSKSDEIFIVPQRDIIGIVEKKREVNKSNEPDNGN